MDLPEILSKLERGEISAMQAERLINSVPTTPKRERGRPKKVKPLPKKNGRPRKLSTHERNLEIMRVMFILDYYNQPWKMEDFTERYCLSIKTIEALYTTLRKRIDNGEVEIDHELQVVNFLTKYQKQALLNDPNTVNLRLIEPGSYSKISPTKPPEK